MPALHNYLSMIAVGAFWGCTNPLLRHGAVQTQSTTSCTEQGDHKHQSRGHTDKDPSGHSVVSSLKKFRHAAVWLPYLLNQMGSVLFYYTLGNSEISLAVPICNGLALVFSILTSLALGEAIKSPLQTIVGSSLVVGGVALCAMSSSSSSPGDSSSVHT